MDAHKTKTNPTGEVRQCDERYLHKPHEYQSGFGSYFNVYCPGNDGKKPIDDDDNDDDQLTLTGYVPVERVDTLVSCTRCGCVLEDDVIGQTIHNVWHDNEGKRVRRYSGLGIIGGR